MTSDLPRRIHEHREGLIPSFTRRYGIKRLVHFEMFESMDEAIGREKRLKDWRRAWKIELIESRNEHWDDLAISWGFTRLPD